ncbi:MAG: hypothetical protein ACI3V1_03060 [Faecousia sp.]
MSVDVLQEKIRKSRNPVILELPAAGSELPAHVLGAAGSDAEACALACRELLDGLKGLVPAVRIRFSRFALLGAEGMTRLTEILAYAGKLGYYVMLDAPGILSDADARFAAQTIFRENTPFPCDSVILGSYLGSDGITPFLPGGKTGKKSVFVAVRTANRSAPELQDLLAGGRLVHTAAADLVSRWGGDSTGKYGYACVGALSAANAPDSLRTLRAKYPRMFLLADGYSAVGANAKNCSHAFDKFGRGAAVCDGGAIAGAWRQAQTDGQDYIVQAQSAAERIKRNLMRYTTIL